MLQAEDGIRDVAVTGVQTCVPSRRRHTRCSRDWSSDVCSSDLYAASVEGKDKKFIPHPATWLNQERWDDEVFAQADSEQDQQNLVHKIFAEMVKPNA